MVPTVSLIHTEKGVREDHRRKREGRIAGAFRQLELRLAVMQTLQPSHLQHCIQSPWRNVSQSDQAESPNI